MSESIISTLISSPSALKLKAAAQKTAAAPVLSSSKPQSSEDKFLAFAKMSPADRMRAQMLAGMGLTEDQLKAMSPEQQKMIEQRIEEQLKQAAQKQLEKGQSAGGFFTDIKV
ncbi:MAG: hypothetical protein ABW213_16990 [Tardiphaga sp.]